MRLSWQLEMELIICGFTNQNSLSISPDGPLLSHSLYLSISRCLSISIGLVAHVSMEIRRRFVQLKRLWADKRLLPLTNSLLPLTKSLLPLTKSLLRRLYPLVPDTWCCRYHNYIASHEPKPSCTFSNFLGKKCFLFIKLTIKKIVFWSQIIDPYIVQLCDLLFWKYMRYGSI